MALKTELKMILCSWTKKWSSLIVEMISFWSSTAPWKRQDRMAVSADCS